MGVAAALGASGAVGAGASIFGASSAANATKQAAQQQQQYAQAAYGQNQGIIDSLSGAAGDTSAQIEALLADAKGSISTAYQNSKKIISSIPSVTQEFGTAQNLSQLDFNYRDAIKKQNLNFVLGDTQQGLRDAQTLNTSLANLDSSQWNAATNRIINSKLLDLKALSVGEPTGSFANLSAQNLYQFSQQGLNNELQISDFFAKNGTVDPVSPLQTAFALQGVDQSIAQLGIQNEQYQGSGLAQVDMSGVSAANQEFANQTQVAGLGIQSNNNLASLLSNSAGSSALAQAQLAQSIGPAIGLATQGLASGYGLSLQQTSLANQQSFNTDYLSYLKSIQNNKSLSTQFAPTYNTSSPFNTSGGLSHGAITSANVDQYYGSTLGQMSANFGVGSISPYSYLTPTTYF